MKAQDLVFSIILERGLVLLQVSLPGRRFEPSLLKQTMALIQTLALIVSRTLDKQVVLQHLVSHRSRHETLVSFRVDLDILSLLSSHLLKLSKDTGGSVVVCRSQDLDAEGVGPILQCSCDEFA